MTEPIALSDEFVAWARRAGYALSPLDDSGAVVLWSDPGGETRYYVRPRDDGWYLLTRSSRSGDEQFALAAASLDVLERFLVGTFGTVLRDVEGLPFLRKPWAADDVAPGYLVSDISDDGYRQLIQTGVGAIAVAREKTTSLMSLVPLSHFLRLSTQELEDSFLSENGAPLMAGDRYASSLDRDS
jgi:hypothetical protein